MRNSRNNINDTDNTRNLSCVNQKCIQLYKCAYKNCIGLHSAELQYVIVNLKDVVLISD